MNKNVVTIGGNVFYFTMKQSILYFYFFLLPIFCTAQYEDQDRLPSSFHAGRREALRRMMPDSSCLFVFAGAERQRANDTKYLYHQDPDFFYLTGLEEPNAVLVLFKEPQTIFDSITCTEVLFVQPNNPAQEAWTGHLLGTVGAKKQLGIPYVLPNSSFADLNLKFSSFSKIFHPEFKNDVRDNPNDRGDLYSLIQHFKSMTAENSSKLDPASFDTFLNSLREVKQPEELVLLRKAIDMSCDAHREVMKALQPEMKEYQAQAIVEYVFKSKGAEYVGYPSIVGSGANSCILHYETNRKEMVGNDLLVIDAGAEYHGYTADITRTLPVDGSFSDAEKAIYNIVLEAQQAGINACKAGNEFRASHKAAVAVVQKRLLELGIIKKETDFLKYFFHGTSHYLGLDVHDAGNYGKLSPGNVITVEPGIYIPAGSDCDPKWWNIGVRIEDDVLITTGEPEVLSGKLPKKISEVEALMKEESSIGPIK